MVYSMMSQTTLPKSFEDYALESVAHILKMVPTKKVEKIPYKFFENSLISQEASGSLEDLEVTQKEDTHPSKNTSEHHDEDEHKLLNLKPTEKKRRQDDQDQDPSTNSEKEKKKRKQKDSESSKKDKDQAGSSKKGKSPSKSSKTNISVNAEETVHDLEIDVRESVEDDVVDAEDPSQADSNEPTFDDVPKQSWFNEMVNTEKDLLVFDDVIGLIINFTKFTKNCLKKDKITKVGLEGPAFKSLKGKHRNYIELLYNFQQWYLALTNKLDWVNPEGDRIPHDLNKPLPFHGAPGRLTIIIDFFLNKDLDYLTNENVEKKYATSLTKPKATSHWEYTFKEVDFLRLNFNDIEDVYVLYVQNKLYHLTGDEQTDLVTDLVTALWFFIRRTVINKRVEDVQLGVENYQTILNIKMPQLRCVGLDIKEPYTMVSLFEQGQQQAADES
ncbi:hypothetical protein Tco_0408029 [Tanacetum coccineum]